MTSLLMHEIQHVKQYASFNHDLNSFGYQYLFQYCKAGFNYNDPRFTLEEDARRQEVCQNAYFSNSFTYAQSGSPTLLILFCCQSLVATLLISRPGRHFFDLWRRSNLFPSIGFPAERTFTTISRPPRNHVVELRFTHGRMRLNITDSNNLCATAFNRNGVPGPQRCGSGATLSVPAVPSPGPLRPRCPPSCPRVAPAECRTDSDHLFPDCDLTARRLCESLWEMCESQEILS